MTDEIKMSSEVKLIDKKPTNDDDETIDQNVIKRKKYRWYQINTVMLPAKFSYFLSARVLINYAIMGLFLMQIGMTKAEVGFVMGSR